MNTWTTPKRNILAAINDLRNALAAGQNARLIRIRNEECEHPIKVKKNDEDFRNYKFNSGHLSTKQEIIDDSRMDDFHKYLTLNYKTCYGTPEAVDRYYESGCLSPDNFKGMGKSHLVSVKDIIAWNKVVGDIDRAEMFRHQYYTEAGMQERHFYDFYRYKHGSMYAAKKFRHKVWAVELLKDDEKVKLSWLMLTSIGLLNAFCYPLKFIPRRSVLRMPEYKVVTFRIGDVTNGFSIEFHVPKKFSFN